MTDSSNSMALPPETRRAILDMALAPSPFGDEELAVFLLTHSEAVSAVDYFEIAAHDDVFTEPERRILQLWGFDSKALTDNAWWDRTFTGFITGEFSGLPDQLAMVCDRIAFLEQAHPENRALYNTLDCSVVPGTDADRGIMKSRETMNALGEKAEISLLHDVIFFDPDPQVQKEAVALVGRQATTASVALLNNVVVWHPDNEIQDLADAVVAGVEDRIRNAPRPALEPVGASGAHAGTTVLKTMEPVVGTNAVSLPDVAGDLPSEVRLPANLVYGEISDTEKNALDYAVPSLAFTFGGALTVIGAGQLKLAGRSQIDMFEAANGTNGYDQGVAEIDAANDCWQENQREGTTLLVVGSSLMIGGVVFLLVRHRQRHKKQEWRVD